MAEKCTNVVQVTVNASRSGIIVDGSRSKQEFEYVFTPPGRADCERMRVFFDLRNGELLIETPYKDRPGTEHIDTTNLVEINVKKMDFESFDLNAPHEQKIPTPGDDAFPVDLPDADKKHVF